MMRKNQKLFLKKKSNLVPFFPFHIFQCAMEVVERERKKQSNEEKNTPVRGHRKEIEFGSGNLSNNGMKSVVHHTPETTKIGQIFSHQRKKNSINTFAMN
jgi:hypothetical protein